MAGRIHGPRSGFLPSPDGLAVRSVFRGRWGAAPAGDGPHSGRCGSSARFPIAWLSGAIDVVSEPSSSPSRLPNLRRESAARWPLGQHKASSDRRPKAGDRLLSSWTVPFMRGQAVPFMRTGETVYACLSRAGSRAVVHVDDALRAPCAQARHRPWTAAGGRPPPAPSLRTLRPPARRRGFPRGRQDQRHHSMDGYQRRSLEAAMDGRLGRPPQADGAEPWMAEGRRRFRGFRVGSLGP